MPWPRNAKIAFIGSHGIRKTTAALAFASVIQRAGRSVEFAREVVRDNPLGINEGATSEAQLWVLTSQIRRELELSRKAECLVTDRGVMDNFAYYLRASGGEDRFDTEPLVRQWSRTYDLVVRLTPDVAIRADGVRSTNDRFRDEIEAILETAGLSGAFATIVGADDVAHGKPQPLDIDEPRQLAEAIAGLPGLAVDLEQVQTNMVYCIIPPKAVRAIWKKYLFYVFDEATSEVRLVTSYDTTDADVKGFLAVVRKAMRA